MEKIVDFIVSKISQYFCFLISEYLVEPIKRHAGYLIYYNSNKRSLETQVEELSHIRSRVQHRVDEARRNGELIEDDVDSWLTEVSKINGEAERFFEYEVKVNKMCLGGCCPNLIARYSLSRKARKMKGVIIELQGKGSFPTVAYRAAPLMGILSTECFGDFESRKLIMEDIVAALKDANINAIGICGLGGVGKTTTVKEVAKRAKAEDLCDEIVMAVVSQTPDVRRVQDEIADKLGLKLEEPSLTGRADRLMARLTGGTRVLVILDDVWVRLDLNEVGIPLGGDHKGCKLMLTSRSQDVCKAMRIYKNFTIGVLPKQEAWDLFKEMAGNSIESPDLRPIAKEVVNECGGLPIAIVTVGRALENEDQDIWKDALQQLRMPNPENVPEMLAEVYGKLELSYNFLKSQEAKSCLLLCCIFKEDAYIWVEGLVRYGMGLGLFKDVNTVAEARCRAHALVQKLKRCYLLLDSGREGYVKMHDVIRDVIRSIATTKGADKQYNSSLHSRDIHKLRNQLDCLKLELLQLASMKLDTESFEGMKELKVLELINILIPSPLPSLSFLTKLQTLCLHNCKFESISVIGELKALKILSFCYSSIKELPQEIGKLTHLLVLDLTSCQQLERISPGVLSSLIQLEELYMIGTFVEWDVEEEEGEERNNVNLAELGSLSRLITLETHLPTAKFPNSIILYKNLERYTIHTYAGEYGHWGSESIHGNELILDLDAGILVDSGIDVLFEKTETLQLKLKGAKNVLSKLTREGLVWLKSLTLSNSEGPECLIDTEDMVSCSFFPILESMEIKYVDNLKTICHGQLPAGNPTQQASFGYLRRIKLFGCCRLENLFLPSIAKCLVQLQYLYIKGCEMIEEIVARETGEHGKATTKITFPKLSELKFERLPNIIDFCHGMDEIEFPQLSTVYLECLPKLMSFCPNNLASVGNHETSTQYLFNEKVKSLCKLRSMTVHSCGKLFNIFSLHLVQSLQNLKDLKVQNCDSLEVIFDFEGVNIEEGHVALALTCLETLQLVSLPKLTHLWKKISPGIQGFQNLKSLEVDCCWSLKNIFTPSVAKLLVKLEKLCVSHCAIMEIVGKDQEGSAKNDEAVQNVRSHECEMMTEGIAEDKGEGDEKDMDKIEIPQLRCLTLQRLPNLVSIFHKGNTTASKFLKTENLKVINVGSGEILAKVAFPSLEELCLIDFNEIWYSLSNFMMEICKIDHKGTLVFENLKSLGVGGFSSLRNLFYPSIARALVHLEKLSIKDCEMMEEIVVKGENEEDRTTKILIPQLKSLQLGRLPNLTSFCQGLNALDFPLLEDVTVFHCPKMKIFSFGDVSTPKLVQVEELRQNSKLFWMGDLNSTIHVFAREAMSSRGKLELLHNDNVERIVYSQLPVDNFFCRLREICVRDCNKLLHVVPSSLLRSLGNLEDLVVDSCASLVEVFEVEGLHVEEREVVPSKLRKEGLNVEEREAELKHILKREPNGIQFFQSLSVVHVMNCNSLRNLFSPPMAKSAKQLQLRKEGLNVEEREAELKHILKREPNGIQFFQSLSVVHVMNCNSLRNLFSPPMAKSAKQLQELKICECEMMTEIVADGEGGGDEKAMGKIEFPRLYRLILRGLPNLISVFPKANIVACNFVNKENLKAIDVGSGEILPKVNLHTDSQHLFNEKVEIPRLEELVLSGMDKLKDIWCKNAHQGTIGFQNLKWLEVKGCGSLRNLFYPSMARGLVHLEQLIVVECEMMEEIVVKEENEEDRTDKIMIPQLKFLRLRCLPNLTSFCQGLYTFDLPLLEDVYVHNCPEMKTFSFGFLSTPKLEKVVEGPNQTSWMDDLNNTIQQLFPRKSIVYEELGGLPVKYRGRAKKLAKGGATLVTFADIEVLEPLHNDNVEQIEPSQLPAGSSCEQREMPVQECDEPLNDDPSSLPQEELTIQRCASLVELLDGEGLYDEETHSVLLSNSKHLVLEDQPELRQFFGDEVLYPGLDKLNFCQNLKSLTVRHCGSLRNLFYPSMVRALVHLETLNIEYCNMLEEIVAKGVEEEEEEEERMDEIVIPQLKRLELYHLPNLISFCQGPYDFDLPSLVDVYVSDCPTLNTFSSGFVSTPKLEEVHEDQLFEMQLTNKQSFWMGGLNNTIQQLALPKKELTKEGDALA